MYLDAIPLAVVPADIQPVDPRWTFATPYRHATVSFLASAPSHTLVFDVVRSDGPERVRSHNLPPK